MLRLLFLAAASSARRLEQRLMVGPLATPTVGLTVEWSDPDSCWDSASGSPARDNARVLVAGILGWSNNLSRVVIRSVRKSERSPGYDPMYVINFEDADHQTSLVDLASSVRKKVREMANSGEIIEANAGTLITTGYLRDRLNTCQSNGNWGHFSVWMKVGQYSQTMPVHVQCWLKMYANSESWGFCFKRIEMVVPSIPEATRDSARWDIPIQMTEWNNYYDWRCTFSKVTDGSNFADECSHITKLCAIGYYDNTHCYGKKSFEGSGEFKRYSAPETNKVKPL